MTVSPRPLTPPTSLPISFLPPLLIALAAMLWGSDLILRGAVVQAGWSPSYIVFAEHVLLTAALAVPLWRGRAAFAALTRREWGLLLFVAVGGSALGTWLYTTAFTLDFSRALTVVLLQKTQPVFALLLAGRFLGERRGPLFWAWCVLALGGAFLLVVADRDFSPRLLSNLHLEQAMLAVGASALWGAATVAGRPLATRLPPTLLAGGRFALALVPLAFLALLSSPPPLAARTVPVAEALILVALLPGLLGMGLYYKGLSKTLASVATLAELCYPLTALLLGVFVQHTSVTPGQWAGLVLLLTAVLGLGRSPNVAAVRRSDHAISTAVS